MSNWRRTCQLKGFFCFFRGITWKEGKLMDGVMPACWQIEDTTGEEWKCTLWWQSRARSMWVAWKVALRDAVGADRRAMHTGRTQGDSRLPGTVGRVTGGSGYMPMGTTTAAPNSHRRKGKGTVWLGKLGQLNEWRRRAPLYLQSASLNDSQPVNRQMGASSGPANPRCILRTGSGFYLNCTVALL